MHSSILRVLWTFHSRSSPLPRVWKVGEMNSGARSCPRGSDKRVEWWLVQRRRGDRKEGVQGLFMKNHRSLQSFKLWRKSKMKFRSFKDVFDHCNQPLFRTISTHPTCLLEGAQTNHFVHRCLVTTQLKIRTQTRTRKRIGNGQSLHSSTTTSQKHRTSSRTSTSWPMKPLLTQCFALSRSIAVAGLAPHARGCVE